MLGPTFDQQEQFPPKIVEEVTGIKSATLRQWESREIYYCELRLQATFELGIIQAPDSDQRILSAERIITTYSRGWRSYTLGDLIRLSFIRELINLGIDAKQAGQSAMRLHIPESNANKKPSGRDLLVLQNQLNHPDEFVLFACEFSPMQFREKDKPSSTPTTDAQKLFFLDSENRDLRAIVKRLASYTTQSPCVLLNLSVLKRKVLSRLEEVEKQEFQG